MSLMLTPVSQHQLCRFLCADVRFGHQSILNDQCWALGTGIGEPKAVSLLTTYGLRAARMHIFPQFSIEDLVLQEPERFHSHPVVAFSSACFVNLMISPFPSLDVEYRIWVPDSQVLVGQVTCNNNGKNTLTVDIDWRVQLQPLQGGSPMRHANAGMNVIMQGECAGLHPVFYLTGGAVPTITDLPGLGNKILLMPGTRRQVTWAMASLPSFEASTQQARQYSSSSLDLEQIKIEMADKRLKVYCLSPRGKAAEQLQHSQERALQLLMPAVRKHAHITYVSDRSPDTGNYPSENILEAQPEWSGQTLPEIYLLSLTLLPGQPDVVKGLLQNFLKIQQQDGRIDLRASVNHNLTGLSSLPMLVALVSDLNRYLNDNSWLEGIYPHLLAFLKTWLKLDESGDLIISELSHPVQLGFDDIPPETNAELVDLWIRLTNPHNIFLLSLLYREVSELLHIAELINREDDREWLEKILNRLKVEATTILEETADEHRLPGKSSASVQPRTILTSFKCAGLPRLKHNLPHPGRIYLRLDHQGKLPADLCCSISGFVAGAYLEMNIKAGDFQHLGFSHLFVSREVFDFIESISIMKMPDDAAGEIGLVDMAHPDILDLVALHAGLPATGKVSRQILRSRIKSHLASGGISVFASPYTDPPLMIPSYMTAMIIEGLARYGNYELAEQLFNHHFVQQQNGAQSALADLSRCSTMRIEDLVPLRLFLKLHGLMKLSNNEIVIAHYDGKQAPVTVQYNQLELLIRHNLTEVHMQSGEVIYLNQPGINKILLE